ncbi:MAG TPA: ATP-dependent RecD-like DNA helicase [Ktedonobacterales bacterium]
MLGIHVAAVTVGRNRGKRPRCAGGQANFTAEWLQRDANARSKLGPAIHQFPGFQCWFWELISQHPKAGDNRRPAPRGKFTRYEKEPGRLDLVYPCAFNWSAYQSSTCGACFRVDDKVLQLRNNYDKEVFNGDSGTITAIWLEEQTMTVRLDNVRRVSYEFSELDELMLAYALSIHKAQGSEYPVCAIPWRWSSISCWSGNSSTRRSRAPARWWCWLAAKERSPWPCGMVPRPQPRFRLQEAPRSSAAWHPCCREAGRAAPPD